MAMHGSAPTDAGYVECSTGGAGWGEHVHAHVFVHGEVVVSEAGRPCEAAATAGFEG
ncbi:MAG: hypothetical protein AAFV33_07410 [Chloroflexota bacterium]